MSRLASIFSLACLALGAPACGDTTQDAAGTATASVEKTAKPAPSASSSSGDKKIPPVLVDEEGPVVNGTRARMKDPGADGKLKRIVSELPIDGRQVEVSVLKKAKLTDVMALVRELGAAGAPTVKISAPARGDLPKEIVVTPQSRLSGKPADCSVVAIISSNFAIDVWNVKGATPARRHTKGQAGPDVSVAGETMTKELKKCDSKVAFFSSDASLDWEYAHIMGGALITKDGEKKLESIVLLDEVPTPGKPVEGFAPPK